MSNPLYQMLGGNMPQMGGPMGNAMQMIQQFNQFRQNFRGDPKAEVMRLLQSGQMSQQQLNQLQSMAQQFQRMTGNMK